MNVFKWSVLVCLGGMLMSASAFAEEAMFAYTYTTDLLPKGQKEMEEWLTWRHEKIAGSFDLLEARTEFEYGVTDKFQAAVYLNYDWTQAWHNGPFGATTPPEPFSSDHPDPDAHYKSLSFIGGSLEGIYRVLSPYTDPLGLAVYEEPTFGPRFIESESKLILQKNYFDDRLIFAFNFTYAPEFRYLPSDSGDNADQWQEETDTNYYFSGSYRFRANWTAGFELLNEHEYNSYVFTNETNSGYFLGPTVHYGGKSFFVTTTFLEQLPWATEHSVTVPGAIFDGRDFDNDFEKYRVRIKVGYYF